MRPAIEVWEDAFRTWDDAPINPARIGDEDRAAAIIEADRAELVAEIVAMIHEQFDAPHIIDAGRKVAAMIEAKFGGRDETR